MRLNLYAYSFFFFSLSLYTESLFPYDFSTMYRRDPFPRNRDFLRWNSIENFTKLKSPFNIHIVYDSCALKFCLACGIGMRFVKAFYHFNIVKSNRIETLRVSSFVNCCSAVLLSRFDKRQSRHSEGKFSYKNTIDEIL